MPARVYIYKLKYLLYKNSFEYNIAIKQTILGYNTILIITRLESRGIPTSVN